MSTYKPDCWVIIKVTPIDGSINYRVFASWIGGYTGADSWKINSGITEVAENEGILYFTGYSGSTYICGKSSYGVSGWGASVLNGIIKQLESKAVIEVMPKDTDWLSIDYTVEDMI